MNKGIFVYHDNPSNEASFLPSGDAWAIDSDLHIFAVADGVLRGHTRAVRTFPFEDYESEVAEIFCAGFIKYAKEYIFEKKVGEGTVNEILEKINQDIASFNGKLDRDPVDPLNYDTPETVGFGAFIFEGKLYYGGLEDCYVNVLRKGSLEQVNPMKYQIMKALKHANTLIGKDIFLAQIPDDIRKKVITEHDWEIYWCTVLRNNPNVKDEAGNKVGFGIFNGDKRATQFFQSHVVDLEAGDRILLFTDGMIPILDNDEITKWMLDNYKPTFDFSHEMNVKVRERFKGENWVDKEKTLIIYQY
ncbi:SpoIIE family protein phosphatase [Candidatus Dojkabacteria bacterium]|nr:SpoIIE family protein phosphatase [Candidatus Dojkabacteria bacterium]